MSVFNFGIADIGEIGYVDVFKQYGNTRRFRHEKTYMVRLTDEERDICLAAVKKLDGEQEAKVIALRLADPPEGRNA